jgi:hypothetical protein
MDNSGAAKDRGIKRRNRFGLIIKPQTGGDGVHG